MARARIYVTGAAGRLGREVLNAIPQAIPLVRKPSGLPGEIVTDYSADGLRRVFADASTVIHLAASRDFLDRKKAREGNVELTRRIVEAVPKSAKIIFASSISVYGKKLAAIPADESTPTRPDTPYAKTKLEAESIVARHPDHIILRIGPIYGPRFDEYSKVLRMLEHGRMPIIGRGDNRIPFVHVSDVAFAVKNALSRGKGIYVIVGECLTQREVFVMAAMDLGVQGPKKQIPAMLAAAYAHFELFRSQRFGGKPPGFIPEDVAVLSSDRSFDCSKAKGELGFSPRPLEQGIREMVRGYRRRKA
jgi:nucleoside-diphosphate-sugar epimerase